MILSNKPEHVGKNVKIAKSALFGKKTTVGDNTVISENVIIYDNVKILPGCYIGPYAILGEPLGDYYKNKTAYKNPPTLLGKNSIIRSGSTIYAGCHFGDNFQTGNKCNIREFSIFGKNCVFGTLSQSDGYIKAGNNCRFHNNVFICTYTTIEDNVHFYPYSRTVDSLHPPCQSCRKGPTLKKGVIICSGALIFPRVKVGKNSIIGADTIVTADVPDGVLAAGSPAKIIKKTKEIRCRFKK